MSNTWPGGAMRLFAELKPLTRDEDRDLRRLHAMGQVGELSPAGQRRYDELRQRDRRKTVRPVDDDVSFLPTPRDRMDDQHRTISRPSVDSADLSDAAGAL